MSLIIALDQGTTSSRALVFDEAAQIVATAQQEFSQIYPEPGWVEHDPQEVWESQLAVSNLAIADAGGSWRDVHAIGITNQRETIVAWDRRTGHPIHNAIVWQDRRTSDFCAELKARGLEPLFQERSGLRLDPYFSGTKIRWLLDNVDGARGLADAGRLAVGTIDSWLIWNLTGGRSHISDVSNASRTLLLNIYTKDWDEDLLSALEIPRSVLPTVVASSGELAETTPAFGLSGTPICGVAGDQQSALFGQMCHRVGMAKNTYGTGCFILKNTGDRPVISRNNLLTTVAWQTNGATSYALEGSVFIAGAAIQWLRDGLGIISSAPEVESLAASVDDTAGVFFVPAFTGLGAPHWDPYARGTVVGLTRGSTGAHLARAALESIAFQTVDVMHAMDADGAGAEALTELRVDGGACRNDLLMQMQSDLLQTPIVRPTMAETTALGAAFLAGLGSGYWSSIDNIDRLWVIDRVFEPQIRAEEAASKLEAWRLAVDRAKGWVQPSG
jgi:glycerol kinase